MLDVSTGEFRTAEFAGPAAHQQALDEFSRQAPAKCCCPRAPNWLRAWSGFPPARASRTGYGPASLPSRLVERQLNVRSLEGFGLTGHPAAAIAAGAVLHYVRTTQKNEALHVDSLKFQEHSTALELDQVTVRNLELIEPLFHGAGQPGNALPYARCMPDADGQAPVASNYPAPAVRRGALEARYEAVAEAHGDLMKREEIRRALSGLLDLERLLARLSLDSAGPRDVRALAASLRGCRA